MRTIGIRELRQHASKWIELVEDGETIAVTSHGRAVALLSPVSAGSAREALYASGVLSRAEIPFSEVPPPQPAPPGAPRISDVLDDLRRD